MCPEAKFGGSPLSSLLPETKQTSIENWIHTSLCWLQWVRQEAESGSRLWVCSLWLFGDFFFFYCCCLQILMSFLFLRWSLCSVCQQCMPSFLLLFLINLSVCLRVCFKHNSITQVCQCVWVISLLIKVRIVLSKINLIVCHRCLFHKYINGVKCTLLFIVWIISFWFCNNSHINSEYAVHLNFIYITQFHYNFQEPGDGRSPL